MKVAGESVSACWVKPTSVRLLPSRLNSSQDALVATLAEEMVQAWQENRHHSAEHYLDRHPQLRQLPPAILDLVYEEICLRRESGQSLHLSEFAQRFPALKHQIAVLLNCFDALEAGGQNPFPSVGDSVGDFRLLEELGRGG